MKSPIRELHAAGMTAQAAIKDVRTEHAARTRFDAHLSALNAVPVPTPPDVLDGVLRKYFAVQLPFESNEKKRKEFPDAFALAALESYAEKHGCLVIAVTRDIGVTRYGKGSQSLTCFSNLDSAIDALLSQAEWDRLVKEGVNLGTFVTTWLPQLQPMFRWHPRTLDRAAPYAASFQARVEMTELAKVEIVPSGPRGTLVTVHHFQRGADEWHRSEAYFRGIAKMWCTLNVMLSVRDTSDGSVGRKSITFATELTCNFSATIDWPWNKELLGTDAPFSPGGARVMDSEATSLSSAIDNWPELPSHWEPYPMA